MKEIILLKNGEIALKGLNRSVFEDKLISNARRRLEELGKFGFRKAQSTIFVEPKDEDIDLDEAVDILQKVYGIIALTKAAVVEKDFEAIKETAIIYLKDELMEAKTFKVDAKRSDKSFPLKSPEICRELGGYILEHFPHLSVDVHNPDVNVVVEVRDYAAYVHGKQLPGAGGIPVGSGGRALLLLSGGIDSPVAGAMMAKRGLEVYAIHFASPPYTSERAKQKVITLAEKMTAYCGRMNLFVVPFTEIQERIKDDCPEELFTIIMRRYMMRIACRIARQQDCEALVTGESVGQVASQTIQAMACTDAVADMPVFRPVVGMDKEEIIKISHKIDTFETSILPYEDCCTVFTPKHPRTKPVLKFVEQAEQAMDMENLIDRAVKGTECLKINR
ncbi:MAG: tRNA 4-thiouridine(8) synthase ThiI [Oscillospiraceae bacterium]|nr:tRNA 4-thiouridine(8) synthase ThiI [Oscillospiraceae bacterium]